MCILILQILLNHVTLLVKVPDGSYLGNGRLMFSSPFNGLVNKSIDVQNEDVLYNWTSRASMSISKVSMPFKALKEIHFVIVQALIDVCSKTTSSIADLSTSTSMCPSSRNSFSIFASNIVSNHLSPCKQHCQGMPKPWAPHLGFGVKYGGFHGGVGASR